MREDRWKLIARNDKSWNMLFDLKADPHEQRELSKQHPEVVRRQKQLLEDPVAPAALQQDLHGVDAARAAEELVRVGP